MKGGVELGERHEVEGREKVDDCVPDVEGEGTEGRGLWCSELAQGGERDVFD